MKDETNEQLVETFHIRDDAGVQRALTALANTMLDREMAWLSLRMKAALRGVRFGLGILGLTVAYNVATMFVPGQWSPLVGFGGTGGGLWLCRSYVKDFDALQVRSEALLGMLGTNVSLPEPIHFAGGETCRLSGHMTWDDEAKTYVFDIRKEAMFE